MRAWGQALGFWAEQHFLLLPLPSLPVALAWLLQGSLSLWNCKSKQPLSYIGFIEALYHKRKGKKPVEEVVLRSVALAVASLSVWLIGVCFVEGPCKLLELLTRKATGCCKHKLMGWPIGNLGESNTEKNVNSGGLVLGVSKGNKDPIGSRTRGHGQRIQLHSVSVLGI